MAHILYDQGKRIGEISDWLVAAHPPCYKNVLGKTVLSMPANDECTFISPRPVNRRSRLTVIEDGKMEFILELKSVKGATSVTAKIVSKKDISKK